MEYREYTHRIADSARVAIALDAPCTAHRMPGSGFMLCVAYIIVTCAGEKRGDLRMIPGERVCTSVAAETVSPDRACKRSMGTAGTRRRD